MTKHSILLRLFTPRGIGGGLFVSLVTGILHSLSRDVVGEGPDGQFGPIVDLELPKDPAQVLLYRALSQMKLVSDLFIGLAEPDQADNLPFPCGEATLQGAFLPCFGLPTRWTNPLLRMRSKLCAAAETTPSDSEDGNLASQIRAPQRFVKGRQTQPASQTVSI